MTCRELVELVTAYFDGALSDADTRRFEEHLTGCDVCVAFIDQIRTTVVLSRRLSTEDVPAPVRDELLHAFRAWRPAEA
jgi:anti-sigma factor RsiW